MRLPHKLRRSSRSVSRPDRARGVQEKPDIYVRRKNEFGGGSYAEAHLMIRRGCYQYLRWREGGKVKEFYLGKVKERTTHAAAAPADRSGRACVVRKDVG